MADVARVDAPAKINLRLRILGREESGYHSLETLFCAVSLADHVEVRRGKPGVRLHANGDVAMGPPEQNLAVRAAETFARWMGEEPAVDIHLTKRIPAAAGLGGGSSDAAAVLRALNALRDEPLPTQFLLTMAGDLGSDVPFFLCGSPLALAWGRGHRLLALPPLPSREVLIAHPGVAMPTAEAFRQHDEGRGEGYSVSPESLTLDAVTRWDAITARPENDFEPVVEAAHPVVAEVREVMRNADMAMLSGSGSCVFGIFGREYEIYDAERRLSEMGVKTWRVRTLEREPRVG